MRPIVGTICERGENIFQTPTRRTVANGLDWVYRSQTSIAFPEGRMNATDYQDLLDIRLLPFGEMIGRPFRIFQKDSASIHVTNSTWEWFLQEWGTCNGMARKFAVSESYGAPLGYFVSPVYADGKQYNRLMLMNCGHHHLCLGKCECICIAKTCEQHV